MFFTSYAGNKLVDAYRRGQAITFPASTQSFGLLTTTNGPRANSTAYALNNTVSVTANDGKTHLYKCTTAGTTAASQASLYPGSISEAITDGTAVFTEQYAALKAGIGGAVVEASYSGYARATLAASLANFSGTQGAGTTVASSGTGAITSSNNSALTFGSTAASGPTYVWAVGTFDAATAGNLWDIDPMASPQTVNNGSPAPTSAISAISCQLDV